MSNRSETLAVALEASYASLLRTLSLLEPDEIEHGRLANEWTPKALIAHVAFWDAVQTQRMQAAMGGATAALAQPTTSNDERAARDDDRPLADVLADAEQARAGLVRFARTVADSQLAVPLDTGNGTLILADRLEHMVRHTRTHEQELWAYCGSMRRWPRARLRAFLVRQEENLMASIGGLSEAVLTTVPVEGDWTIRDSLVHILAWREYGYLVVKHWPAVDAKLIASWRADSEVDTTNAAILQARAALNMIDIADGLTTYHRRLMKLFDQASDSDLASTGDHGWGDQGELAAFFYGLAYHEMEHAEKIWEFRVAGREDDKAPG